MQDYKIGTFVSHRSDGICKIVSIEEINGKPFYKLESTGDFHNIVYSPVDSQNQPFRNLITKQETDDLLKYMTTITNFVVESSKKRRELFKSLLYSNDPKKLVFLLKNLYLYKLDKERKNQFLSQEDKYIYKRVKKLLGEEFSIVLNINQEEADNKIKSFIIR